MDILYNKKKRPTGNGDPETLQVRFPPGGGIDVGARDVSELRERVDQGLVRRMNKWLGWIDCF